MRLKLVGLRDDAMQFDAVCISGEIALAAVASQGEAKLLFTAAPLLLFSSHPDLLFAPTTRTAGHTVGIQFVLTSALTNWLHAKVCN